MKGLEWFKADHSAREDPSYQPYENGFAKHCKLGEGFKQFKLIEGTPKVVKASSAKCTPAKATATHRSSIVCLLLASGLTLRKLSASQSSESSPSKTVAERTRKKTKANEITDDAWIVVRRRVAEVKVRLTHVQVKAEYNR